MASIRVERVSLVYPVWRKASLLRRQEPPPFGGRIVGSARGQFVKALGDVSFALQEGDRLGLIGSNGAGKTTLLKVLYGIYEPTSGSVAVDGRIDALFNINLGFRGEATGRRNIELRSLINGWSLEEIDRRMDDIIAFSELGPFIDMPMKAYSRGMSARLAFSVATALEPEILLMDEWIGAGDPGFQEKARERMADITKKAGIIVLASHNHGLLKKICNKILHLEAGEMKAFGEANVLLNDGHQRLGHNATIRPAAVSTNEAVSGRSKP